MRKIIIKSGDKFGMLTAIRFDHRDKKSNQHWLFRCDCGVEKVMNVDNVKRGRSKSCGCLMPARNIKHGMRKSLIWGIWYGMKRRCLDPNRKDYKNYGGRGIKVCKRWLVFENFYADMGERPEGKTLDRKNNDGNYCKSNCRWATPTEQNNNTRKNDKNYTPK